MLRTGIGAGAVSPERVGRFILRGKARGNDIMSQTN